MKPSGLTDIATLERSRSAFQRSIYPRLRVSGGPVRDVLSLTVRLRRRRATQPGRRRWRPTCRARCWSGTCHGGTRLSLMGTCHQTQLHRTLADYRACLVGQHLPSMIYLPKGCSTWAMACKCHFIKHLSIFSDEHSLKRLQSIKTSNNASNIMLFITHCET